MAVGRRQDRWTCGQTDDLTSRKVSLTLLWSGSPEAPRISRGAMHSRAHRRWWRRARNLTPPPGRLSPAPVPGGASAQKTDAFPPSGPRTLDLMRLVRRGPAPSAPTAEAWRPELSEGLRPNPLVGTLTFPAGGSGASPPRGCSGPRDPPPKGGSSVADAAEQRSHSLASRVGSAFFYHRATSLCSLPVAAFTHSGTSQFRCTHHTRDRLLPRGINNECT